MHPLANLFFALSTLVPNTLAELAIRLSSVAMTYPFPSASSATLNSLIPNFNTSVLPSPSSLATSQSINKTFYSLKNMPCFLPLRPRSTMTNFSPVLILKSSRFRLKSRHSPPSKMTSFTLADYSPHNPTLKTSFIAALITIAMDSPGR